jgi:hypothetical protein
MGAHQRGDGGDYERHRERDVKLTSLTTSKRERADSAHESREAY